MYLYFPDTPRILACNIFEGSRGGSASLVCPGVTSRDLRQ